MYTKVYQDYFALPGFIGKKSKAETFPGADTSLTYETLMPSSKALQSGTSHDLGQNFAKAFDVSFQDKLGQKQYVWQTSWGLSTRSIGGLIMAHGDDHGLRLPPELAPIQVIIIPVDLNKTTLKFCQQILQTLNKVEIRAKIDDRDDERLGFKINKWELKGVPLRLEVGQKEVQAKKVTLVRRDNGEKELAGVKQVTVKVKSLLAKIQANLYHEAKIHLKNNTHEVDNYQKFKTIMSNEKGFIKAFWCGDPACEQKIKEETKTTTRCLPLNAKKEKGKCIYCQKSAKYRWYFAQAY